jgi:hypothetical protein
MQNSPCTYSQIIVDFNNDFFHFVHRTFFLCYYHFLVKLMTIASNLLKNDKIQT